MAWQGSNLGFPDSEAGTIASKSYPMPGYFLKQAYLIPNFSLNYSILRLPKLLHSSLAHATRADLLVLNLI